MNILIIGCAAREHAIAQGLYRSPIFKKLYCCGPYLNPAIDAFADDYQLCALSDHEKIIKAANHWQINMAVIGPEAPLAQGLADALWQAGIPTIGPKKILAQIETSKVFARNLMQEYQIEGLPKFRHFQSLDGIEEFLTELGDGHYVIKANGLMAGKGVKVAGEHLYSKQQALSFCQEILTAGQSIVIEEKLIGLEFSLMCFCDGTTQVAMPLVQDHKRAFVGDKGPNTGGMGSYSMANHLLPFVNDLVLQKAKAINYAMLDALQQKCEARYIGILYGSFIATDKGIYVIEFNARFGDPEVLNVLNILESDLLAIFQSMLRGDLDQCPIYFAPLASVCKYVVPMGYPDQPIKDNIIDISAVNDKNRLYLASVTVKQGTLYAQGSRTAAYVGVAKTLALAEQMAEQEIQRIEGAIYHREDIGTEALVYKTAG
jgi:phosphoribosylamine---glycine ligase